MLFEDWIGDLVFGFKAEGCRIILALFLVVKCFELLGATPFSGILCTLGVQASTVTWLFTVLGATNFVELFCALAVQAVDAINTFK